MQAPILYSAGYSSRDPFRMTDKIVMVNEPDDLKPDGILLLHGGGDISPTIYNQKPIARCNAGESLTGRDVQELRLIDRARKLEMPIIGICRGAQLICAVDGGYLIQHITNHTSGDHSVLDVRTGHSHKTTSCHHQMMVPLKKHKNIILAIDKQPVSGFNKDMELIEIKAVPEVVFFPKMKALGIQGHPEWSIGKPFNDYCRSLIHEFLWPLGD